MRMPPPQTRMNHLREKGYPHPEGGESCGSDCMVHGLITCFTGLGWILQIPLRGHVRERYRIRGAAFGDWSVLSHRSRSPWTLY